MFKRQEWASLLGFMLTGLILGLCGAVIGRRRDRVIAGIIAGYVLFLALVTTNYWLSVAA